MRLWTPAFAGVTDPYAGDAQGKAMNSAAQFILTIILYLMAAIVPFFSLVVLLKEESFIVLILAVFYIGAAVLHIWLHFATAARAAAGGALLAAVIASHCAFFLACAFQCDIMEGRPNMFILLIRLFGELSPRARMWQCSVVTDILVFVPWAFSLLFVSGSRPLHRQS